jgi:hypothetical protein
MSDPVKTAQDILTLEASYKALAQTAHNLYVSFTASGFNDTQALFLTSQWLNHVVTMTISKEKKI